MCQPLSWWVWQFSHDLERYWKYEYQMIWWQGRAGSVTVKQCPLSTFSNWALRLHVHIQHSKTLGNWFVNWLFRKLRQELDLWQEFCFQRYMPKNAEPILAVGSLRYILWTTSQRRSLRRRGSVVILFWESVTGILFYSALIRLNIVLSSQRHSFRWLQIHWKAHRSSGQVSALLKPAGETSSKVS